MDTGEGSLPLLALSSIWRACCFCPKFHLFHWLHWVHSCFFSEHQAHLKLLKLVVILPGFTRVLDWGGVVLEDGLFVFLVGDGDF